MLLPCLNLLSPGSRLKQALPKATNQKRASFLSHVGWVLEKIEWKSKGVNIEKPLSSKFTLFFFSFFGGGLESTCSLQPKRPKHVEEDWQPIATGMIDILHKKTRNSSCLCSHWLGLQTKMDSTWHSERLWPLLNAAIKTYVCDRGRNVFENIRCCHGKAPRGLSIDLVRVTSPGEGVCLELFQRRGTGRGS